MSETRSHSFKRRFHPRTELEKLGANFNAEAEISERLLKDQPLLKDYGKIMEELKSGDFERIKRPQSSFQPIIDFTTIKN